MSAKIYQAFPPTTSLAFATTPLRAYGDGAL
jgi:hypothetical protein